MIDVKLPLRKAYYQLLNGQLSFGGNNVPVYDDVAWLQNTDSLYVLLMNNSSVDRNTQQSFSSEEDIILDIIFTAAARANKETVDIVASQIQNLVCPNPQQNGLPVQAGIWIDNVYKSADNYMDFTLQNAKSVIRRIITFSQLVTQTDFGTVIPASGPAFITGSTFKFISADFINATDCPALALNGLGLAIFFNENQIFLNAGIDFSYLPGGGFKILISGFDATSNNYTFYVSVLTN